jgi:hypothetical protein
MLKYRNFGRKSLKEIQDVLASMNLSLGLDVDQYYAGRGKSAAARPAADDETAPLADESAEPAEDLEMGMDPEPDAEVGVEAETETER